MAARKPRYWKSLQLHKGHIVSAHDKSPWTVGEWREVPAPVKECEGLNCCEYIVDAMRYVNMEVLAEVEIDGKRITGDDKITVQRMRIIRAWHWTREDTVLLVAYETKFYLEYLKKESRLNKIHSKKEIEFAEMLIENPTYENMVEVMVTLFGYSRFLLSGGFWSYAGAAGVGNLHAYHDASDSFRHFGARLEFRADFFKKIQEWIVKHTTDMQVM